DIALLDRRDGLLLQRALDLGPIESRPFFDGVLAEVADHVEQHCARGDSRYLLNAELLQPIRLREVDTLVAVVVDAIDSDVPQAIDLRAAANPPIDDVVVIRRLRRPKTCAPALAGLQDDDLERTRWIGGRVLVGLDPEPVSFSGGD